MPVVAFRLLSLAALGAALAVLLSATSLPLPRPSPVAQASSQGEELPPPRTVPPTAVPTGTPAPAVPSTLPGNLLIADRANNRVIEVTPDQRIVWEFPRPGDLAPGQHFRWPDDAFYAPDGRSIIVNEEESAAIVLVDYATHRIVWQYGVSERPGRSAGHLNGPDDAYMLRDGTVTVADIRNCRLLRIDPSTSTIITQLGSGACVHRPASSFGLPNGDTPLPNGHVLVTEISGSWVSEVSWEGSVLWSVRIPSVRYASDAQLTRDGNILLVDYSRPGQVLKVAKDGTILWRYGPRSGPGLIDHPSLAIELSNGLIALNDDFRHRVVVIDPRTDQIVWQYGLTDRLGRTAGLLYVPDGIDIKPFNWGIPAPFLRRSGKVPEPF